MSPTKRRHQRYYERVDVALRVRLFLSDEDGESLRFEAFAETSNLCPGGIYLATTLLLPRNAKLWLELDLPEGPFVARCRVAHRTELDDERFPTGMGIEFLDVAADGREQLLRYFTPSLFAPFHAALVREFPHIEREVDPATVNLVLNLWEEWKIREEGGPAATASGAPRPSPFASRG